MSNMLSVNCVECNAAIELNDPIVGEIVVCPDCGVDLEVMSLEPLTVNVAPMEQEDWGE
jgi:alpha-aminoadipate/glutamate carrier protein LysW